MRALILFLFCRRFSCAIFDREGKLGVMILYHYTHLNAGICSALADVCFGPKADINTELSFGDVRP